MGLLGLLGLLVLLHWLRFRVLDFGRVSWLGLGGFGLRQHWLNLCGLLLGLISLLPLSIVVLDRFASTDYSLDELIDLDVSAGLRFALGLLLVVNALIDGLWGLAGPHDLQGFESRLLFFIRLVARSILTETKALRLLLVLFLALAGLCFGQGCFILRIKRAALGHYWFIS